VTDVALRVLAPRRAETELLRACLPTGATGRAAFERWSAALGDPAEGLRLASPQVSALLPNLLHAAEANGARVDRRLMTIMRAAWTHEELRGAAFASACRDVLAGLEEAAIVLPGVALVATVYGDWPLRHCHDLDLLVRAGAGRSVHPSGMPAVRHTVLGTEALLAPDVEPAWEGAVPATVAGVDARVLGGADALVYVCVHAATQLAPPPSRWALDAWWIAARGDVDWSVLAERATPPLAPVLSALLGWLASELEAPVPPDVLEELRRAAGDADRRWAELSLSFARRRAGAVGLVRRAGRDRPLAIRTLVAPSGDYLRLRGVSRGGWMRRGAVELFRNRGGPPEAARSPEGSSSARAPRAAGTPAAPPRAR
jgi:hypothetical protein